MAGQDYDQDWCASWQALLFLMYIVLCCGALKVPGGQPIKHLTSGFNVGPVVYCLLRFGSNEGHVGQTMQWRGFQYFCVYSLLLSSNQIKRAGIL